MRKIYVAILAIFMGLGLVACKKADDRTVLTYAAWNLGTAEQNNIERRLIQAYQDENPDIRIEVIPRPTVSNEDGTETDASWFDFFSTRAATGTLPDVYQVADLTTWITQGWVEDIADLAATDTDLALVPEDIVNNTKFRDHLFGLPQAMYYYGFFINRTVATEMQSYKPVTYGMQYSDLMIAAKANHRIDFEGNGSGIAGIDGMGAMLEWLPGQYDGNLDWFTFNETNGYSLNSQAFSNAMTEQRKYMENTAANYHILDSLTETDKNVQYGSTNPWGVGKQSIKWAASYNLRDWLGATQNPESDLYEHDIDFIGTPAIGENHRVPVIMDYIALGRGTKMREQAYDFARYMSYGIKGYTKRLDIARSNPEAGAVNFAPIAQSKALIDAYFALYPTMTEYRKLVETHTSFMNESLWKTTPGYWKSRSSGAYSETEGVGEIINKVIKGELQLADVASGLNTAANREWQNAKVELETALDNFSRGR